ncbi:DUF4190 domain-containing protein [Natronosporangium hydrolyticum]|nr:DUF4190 domain-containing protein [Natronosporangium hydrolyticum]
MRPPAAPSHPPRDVEAGVNLCAIWALPLAVGFSIAGVVLGHVARHEIRRTGERGDGLAKAALAIGYPVTALWLTCWVPMILSVTLAE